MNIPFGPRRRFLAAGAMAALVSACGGGVDNEEERRHTNTFIDTAGRLAIAEAGAATVRIHDLDRGVVDGAHAMVANPTAVYASPGGRYAVVVQSSRVQFVDGGVWQEDHGDHLHDYRQASSAKGFVLSGSRPSHYDPQPGVQASLYFDGDGAATPPVNASAVLLTDDAIGAGRIVATASLDAPLHGFAEPVGDKLLTVRRAADAPDALPTHLVLKQRSGSGGNMTYNVVRQLPTRCERMHGLAGSGSSTLVGCSGGMLLVRHLSASSVDDGRFLATPLRVTTVAGHVRLPDQFIGIATEGAAPGPVTTRFYAVDGTTGTVADFVPQGWATGHVRRAHGFDRSGQRFFIVDNQGNLIVSQRQGSGWAPLARVAAAIPVMPSAAPWPSFAANGAKDEVYITDPVARQVVVVHGQTGAVLGRRDLGYAPSAMAWLGITR